MLCTPLTVQAQFGPTKVVAATAEMKQLPATMTLVGTVEPRTRTTIGAEVAGMVMAMPTRQGDRVEKGGLICQLDEDILSLTLQREEAHLAALQAQLEELVNGTRQEELARLKAELHAAEAMAQRWAYELDRIKRLEGSDYANQKEYQDTLAEKVSAENKRLAAQAMYEQGIAGPRVEVIAAARAAVAQQQAETNRIRTELEKAKTKAPFTGYIVTRYAEVGDWLSQGDEIVEFVDLASVLVRVDVPEKAIPYATVGSDATVRIDALSKSYSGKIKHVIPQADRTARTFPVEIEIANPDFELKAGMFARATVQAGPEKEVLAIPKDALIDNGDSITVAMIVDGEQGTMAMPTHVTLGADAGNWIAVTSGNIPPGAQVATYGNEQLLFPQPVMVVESHEQADSPGQEKSEQKSQVNRE